MKMMALWKATLFATSAMLAAACVVTTSDDDDDDIEDLDDGGRAGASGRDNTGGQANGGTDQNGSAGADNSAAGADNSAAGAAGNPEPAGECTTTMYSPCEECLVAKGFSNDDDSGVWDECKDTYPCCEEATRYVTCVQQTYGDAGLDIIPDEYDGDGEAWCFEENVPTQLGLDQASEPFHAIVADALTEMENLDDTCWVECMFPDDQ